MARPLRIHYEGAVYQVTVSGDPQLRVFGSDGDRREYLEIIRRYKEKYGFRLYAYVILDHEAHLLIKVGSVPLSTVMQAIQQVYTRSFNERNRRQGPIFPERYQAELCLDDVCFAEAIKRIHQLPTVQRPPLRMDYPFSSHKQFMWRGELADADEALQVFSRYKSIAIGQYNDFMRRRLSRPDRERLMSDSPNRVTIAFPPPEQAEQDAALEFDSILNVLAQLSGVEAADIVGNTKVPGIVRLRRAAIILACRHTKLSKARIARALGVGASTVTNTLNGRYKKTEEFKDFCDEAEERLLREAAL